MNRATSALRPLRAAVERVSACAGRLGSDALAVRVCVVAPPDVVPAWGQPDRARLGACRGLHTTVAHCAEPSDGTGASDSDFSDAGTGSEASDGGSVLGGSGLLADSDDSDEPKFRLDDRREEMIRRAARAAANPDFESVFDLHPETKAKPLPDAARLPKWDWEPPTIPADTIPSKDDYLDSLMPDDTAPPREPDWETATAEEEEVYVAKLAEHKKRMAELAEEEKPDFWRLDQVRARPMPEWMKHEALESDDEKVVVEPIVRESRPDLVSVIRWPMRDAHGFAYATGKRKTAIAQVWVREGDGVFNVNRVPLAEYFVRSSLRAECLMPLITTQTCGAFDVQVYTRGGGLSGQAGAIKHGVAKALANYDPFFRSLLKSEGLLKRDPRMVERKKPGQKKARKKFQWVKR